jgi:hypothetical protein
MKQENLKPIFLTSRQIEILYNNNCADEGDRDEEVPGFEGFYIDTDTSTGRFDSGKSSMMDYEIYLYDKEDELIGTAIGGYYNGGCGEKFNYDLTFYPTEQETPESKFNEFLLETSESSDSLKKKITKIKKYLSKLEA